MTLPKFKHDDLPQNNTEPNNIGGGDSFDEPPRHVPKAVKWAAGTAIGLVLLAGAGGLIATQLIDQQKYKSMIVSKVEDATGYTVDWDGNINLGMMPLPHASVSKLTVKAGNTEILSIAKADIQVALAPLLSKKIEIKNITIDEPVVTLLTTKSGVQTWVAKPKATSEASESKADTAASTDAPMDVVINSIEMNGGTVVIDNQQAKSRQELKNINLDVRADSLKGPFDVSGDTEWSGQKIELKATSGEINVSEGSYPIQTSLAVPSAGINVSFSGVVDAKNMGANGDVNLDIDDVAKAVKGMTGSAPSLPDGIGGKASVAGKLVYNGERVAVDDMALALGKLAYSGRVAADGLGENSTPQLLFQLAPTTKAGADAPQVVQLLSGLTVAAKGTIENEKIQIATANLKTMGNDISINGYSSMGASPKVDLTINAPEINLDALTGTTAVSAEKDAKAAPAMSAKNMGFTVPFAGRVRANVGKLTTGGKTYSDIQADVTSNAGALTIANAAVSLPQDTSLSVSGKIADTSKLTGMDLKLSAKTQDAEKLMASFGVTPPELPKKLGAASLNGNFIGDLEKLGFSATVSALQFNVKGEGSVGDPMGIPAISSLKFNINHPNFNEALKTLQPGFAGSSGFYGALDVGGQLAWGDNKFEVSAINGKLGQTTVAGNVTATTEPRTKVSGALDFGAIVLPSASNNGGSVAASSTASASAKGDRWSRETIDTAWMRAFDADLSIKAKSITQNLWKLSDANLAFKLNNGTLTLDDVSAGLFGGRASINGTIRSGVGDKDPLTITTKMNADNVNAQQLMSAVTGKPSYVLTGTLSNVDVSVNATGSSAATLIQTLDGTGVASGKEIIVTGVDIVALSNAAGGSYKPLERIGALSKSMGGSNQTKFDTFESEFAIEDGIVNLRKNAFDSADASMTTSGTVNLPAWTLNLTNKLILKSNEADPISFTITGSLDNPAQSGLEGILMNRFDKLINKDGTKLNKVLGKFLGTPKSEEAAPAPTPVTDDAAPVEATPNDAAPDTAPAPEAKQPTKDEIKAQQAQEAVKAIQGLFGR